MEPGPLHSRLQAGATVYSGWCTMPSAIGAEALARDGWDAVVVDTQHGLIGYGDAVPMVQAVQGAGALALLRVPLGDVGFIAKALDLGVDGLICPMINSVEDAQWLARATRFPPHGERSWGPHRAMLHSGLAGPDYLANGGRCFVWAMIETAAALDRLDDILALNAFDGVFVGPNDLCVSLTGGAHVEPGRPEVEAAVDRSAEKANAHGLVAGIYANTPELGQGYARRGYRFIAGGSDLSFLRSASRAFRNSLAGA